MRVEIIKCDCCDAVIESPVVSLRVAANDSAGDSMVWDDVLICEACIELPLRHALGAACTDIALASTPANAEVV
jgi:hypothetical protein